MASPNTNAPSSFSKPAVAGTDILRNNSIETAKKYVGERYSPGSTGMDTFDCSGFAQTIYKQFTGIKIPAISALPSYAWL